MCLPLLAALPAVIGAAASAAGTAGVISATTATAISLASTVAGTALSAIGQYQQAKSEQQMHEYNAQVARVQARDAERRGSMAESLQHQRTQVLVGQQRAALGASGTLSDSGSNLDLLAQSAEFGYRDAAVERANGMREAWGHRAEARNENYQAGVAQSSIIPRVGGTLLSGAAKVFNTASPWWSSWQSSSSPGPSPDYQPQYAYMNP